MLSDEEKKAIEELKKVRWNSLAVVVKNEDGKMDISYFTVKHKKTLLNLIEKQSKEIEELFAENQSLKYTNGNMIHKDVVKVNYTPNDKIKAKIEEFKDKCKKCNFRGKICDEFTKNYNCVIGVCLKEFYSLLEKE